ncbi:MAG: cysteine-rich CWC family protein [Gammaproteobacteria bacterium]
MTKPDKNKVILEECPACGSLVNCAITNGGKDCWCMHLPNVLPVPEAGTDKTCYCESCLEIKIRKTVETAPVSADT